MAFPAASTYVLGINGTNLTTALEDQLAATKMLPGAQDETELTIASGSVAATLAQHSIDTESDAATDVLTNITVASFVGKLLLVTLENDARIVTMTHEAGGAGQLSFLGGQDLVLDSTKKHVWFWVDSGASPVTLREVARFGYEIPEELEVNTAISASPNILTVAECGKVFSNEGATAANYHTLPTARAGLGPYTFIVQDVDGIRVVANTGDTIRHAATVSGAAGFIEAATIGNVVTLYAINDTEWIVTSIIGTWTVT